MIHIIHSEDPGVRTRVDLILDSVLRRSAIEIDTCDPEHPKLNLDVVIEGNVYCDSCPKSLPGLGHLPRVGLVNTHTCG